MTWRLYRNLENSLKDFLDTEISNDSITDINGTAVPVRIGRKEDDNWTLPCISLYMESRHAPQGKVISFPSMVPDLREKSHLQVSVCLPTVVQHVPSLNGLYGIGIHSESSALTPALDRKSPAFPLGTEALRTNAWV